VLKPLAIAANATQGDDARLDTVPVTLANLHRKYAHPQFPEEIRKAVHGSIKKRWHAADQPAFLLALTLNPFIRLNVFSPASPLLHFPTLWSMFAKFYARIYCLQGPSLLLPDGLRETLKACLDRQDIWANEEMQLNYWSRAAEAKVCSFFHKCAFLARCSHIRRINKSTCPIFGESTRGRMGTRQRKHSQILLCGCSPSY
jgi:hypothetical protein